jgi:hypothetical protein
MIFYGMDLILKSLLKYMKTVGFSRRSAAPATAKALFFTRNFLFHGQSFCLAAGVA